MKDVGMKKEEWIVNGEIDREIERTWIMVSNTRMKEKLSEFKLWEVLRD